MMRKKSGPLLGASGRISSNVSAVLFKAYSTDKNSSSFFARICLAINILFLFSALASGVTGASRIMPKYSLRRLPL